MPIPQKRVLLIIGGGIAAYKSLELIRRLREEDIFVRAVMTAAAQRFITKLSVESLTQNRVHDDLFAPTDDSGMGHIELSRDADLAVIAPATADLLAKMAQGLANDLASTLMLATDKKILAAPAMNIRMWLHPATQRNLNLLRDDGVAFVGPEAGEMACGEFGPGRMSEPPAILTAIKQLLQGDTKLPLPGRLLPLKGRRVVVTSGPTIEPLDEVRFISNRSSGKQGHAIAAAAAAAGADVALVTGPVALPDPSGVRTVHVETAREMLDQVEAALPADIFIAVAAVADWRPAMAVAGKIKKNGKSAPALDLVENSDILAAVGRRDKDRPVLVIGFAAESENAEKHARGKLRAKNCDMIVANEIGKGTGVFGGEMNKVLLLTPKGGERWPPMSKREVAERLIRKIAATLGSL
ncbi:MAG TPA: bifunctional phosphopantothenoylcysteine decarboxylase/phosphopantothenate--cysteine ligase CoaBC [Methylocella sp.]|nr:bifunctional phosphopantothenoylcysteine decarboxylase/phosphopantothenate--cysteine ligase CoaBC [Methylocella sp.]